MIVTSGSVESCDCLIRIEDHDSLVIEIKSVVKKQFGKQIKQVITDTLHEHQITSCKVMCFDQGALDYTIKARLTTAIKKWKDKHE